MRFLFNNTFSPPETPTDNWTFQADLRNEFRVDSNHNVESILKERNIITGDDEIDAESACTWAYFNTEQAARKFLRLLNAQPEIKSWKRPTKERFILLREKEFKAMQKLVKTLPKKHQTAFKALKVGIYGVEEHLFQEN